MSTTNGTMKSFRVTDPNGNVYVMIPVDTTARTTVSRFGSFVMQHKGTKLCQAIY